MFRSFFDFMAGAFGLLVAVLPVLFAVLVKGDYGDAYIQIPILLMASFFFSLTGYLGGIYVAYMKTKSVGITTAVSAVCNLVINLTLIHFIGLYAASVSTLVSYILLTVYRMIDVQRFVKIKYDVGHILLILAVLAVMSGLAMMQTLSLNLLNVVIGAALFAILDGKMVFHFAKKALSRIKK
jgi:O-antigen/teichoic acid export membrane protein